MKLHRTAWARFALVPLFFWGTAGAPGISLIGVAAAAESCAQPSDPINTDRPSTTNSSTVVPLGSLQSENGINLSRSDGTPTFDGTNSRLRFGIAPCLEMLLDIPNYVTALRSPGNVGFTDAAPALKWQISPVPGKIDLSMTIGAELPTGATRIAGAGVQPYLQFPWSVDLGAGFSIAGMETNLFLPADSANHYSNQSTFVIEKTVNERSFLFVEYVGNFPINGGASHLFNSGGGYRITPNQQIDFHIAFGLNQNAPAYVFGVGYSFRFDSLLRK